MYKIIERLEVGTVHMCLSSVFGYRPLINPPPSLGNLLLDITNVQFHSGVVLFFSVNFRVRVRVRVSYRVRV